MARLSNCKSGTPQARFVWSADLYRPRASVIQATLFSHRTLADKLFGLIRSVSEPLPAVTTVEHTASSSSMTSRTQSHSTMSSNGLARLTATLVRASTSCWSETRRIWRKPSVLLTTTPQSSSPTAYRFPSWKPVPRTPLTLRRPF